MVMYLGTFAVSFGLALYGDSLRKKKNMRGFALCMILAVLAAAVLAGLRDVTVGTDSVSYWKWEIDARYVDNFAQCLKKGSPSEPLFMVLVYAAGKYLGCVQWLYFLASLIGCGFAMAAFVWMRDVVSIPYAWVSYLFLFYGHSLNGTRQAIAMTIVLLALFMAMRGKYLWYVILTVLAYGFHNSAVLSVGFLALYLILKKWNTLPVKAVLVGGMIAAVVCYEPLFLFLAKIGLVSSRFATYLKISSVHFSLNPILVRLPFFLLVLFFYRDFAKEEKTEHDTFRKSDADFLVIMMIADMITAELRIISVPIYRVSLYFSVFRCMAIGRVLHVLKKDPERKNWARLVAVGAVALLVVIWLYQVVLKGNDGIYPYTSRILHIGRETLI